MDIVARILQELTSGPAAGASVLFAAIERERCRMTDGGYPTDRPETHSGADLGRLATTASKSPRWAEALHGITRAVGHGGVLELGTAVGISGAYIAGALKDRHPGHRLTSVEIDERSLAVADELFDRLGLGGIVEFKRADFLDYLESMAETSPFYSLVFKDVAHTQAATVASFEMLAARASTSLVVVVDDIRRSPDMTRGWHRVRKHPSVARSLDLLGMGVLIVSGDAASGHTGRRHYVYGLP